MAKQPGPKDEQFNTVKAKMSDTGKVKKDQPKSASAMIMQAVAKAAQQPQSPTKKKAKGQVSEPSTEEAAEDFKKSGKKPTPNRKPKDVDSEEY